MLHTGHQGIERTKSNVRSTMYWPNTDMGINRICNCNTFKILKDLQKFATKWQLIYLYVLTNSILLLQITPGSTLNQPSYQMPHQIQLLPKLKVYLHDAAYLKQWLLTMKPTHSTFKIQKFSKSWDLINKTSSPKFPQNI